LIREAVMAKESGANGNGTLKRISIAITVVVLVVGIAVVWGARQATIERNEEQIKRLDEKKLDKEVFDERSKGMDRSINEIKAGQVRMNDKLDKVLEKL